MLININCTVNKYQPIETTFILNIDKQSLCFFLVSPGGRKSHPFFVKCFASVTDLNNNKKKPYCHIILRERKFSSFLWICSVTWLTVFNNYLPSLHFNDYHNNTEVSSNDRAPSVLILSRIFVILIKSVGGEGIFNILSYELMKNLRYGLLIKKLITEGRTREEFSWTGTQYLFTYR